MLYKGVRIHRPLARTRSRRNGTHIGKGVYGSKRQFVAENGNSATEPTGDSDFDEMSGPGGAEGTLQNAQVARLIAILEASSSFAGVLDRDRRLVYLNQTARRMLGIGSEEDISNMEMSGYFPWVAQPVGQAAFHTAIRGDRWSGDVRCRGRGGRDLLLSLVLASHVSPDGTIDCFSMIASGAADGTAQARH